MLSLAGIHLSSERRRAALRTPRDHGRIGKVDDRLKTARKRLADVRGRLTVIDAALDDLRLERARLEDLVLEAESELNELEPFGGTGHPEIGRASWRERVCRTCRSRW